MIKTTTGYWNKYYKSLRQDNKESNFAKFIKDKLVNKKDIILDVATGDGRDAFFFSKFSKTVYGIDESKVVIKLNNQKTKAQKINNLTFLNVKSEKIKNLSKKKISLIYARFFIHAIKERTENKFLDDIKKYFDKNTIVALEFRTTKDKLIKKGTKIGKNERLTSHYRRFINTNNFEKKIKNKNFTIIFKKLGINMSKTPMDNPHLCRLIIKQK